MHFLSNTFCFFLDTSPVKLNDSEDNSDNGYKDSSSDDEEFHTPPQSPSLLEECSDDEEFHDSVLPDRDVYIAG